MKIAWPILSGLVVNHVTTKAIKKGRKIMQTRKSFSTLCFAKKGGKFKLSQIISSNRLILATFQEHLWQFFYSKVSVSTQTYPRPSGSSLPRATLKSANQSNHRRPLFRPRPRLRPFRRPNSYIRSQDVSKLAPQRTIHTSQPQSTQIRRPVFPVKVSKSIGMNGKLVL